MQHKFSTAKRSGGRRLARFAGGALAVLAASALFNRAATAAAERRTPPTGCFVDAGGTRLHYIERGSGPAIVLIHGNGSLIQDWEVSGLVERLAVAHRVIVFDRPGYGYSPRPRDRDWMPEVQADAFVAACAALGVERPVVVGHSFGTLPALAWALNHPLALSGVVLLSGYHYPVPRADMLPLFALGTRGVVDVVAHTLAPLQGRLTGPLGNKFIFAPAPITEAYKSEMPFGLMLRPVQLRATAADGLHMLPAAQRLAPRLGELTLPVAVGWGDGDLMVRPGGQSERLAAEVPHARRLELTGVGHMIHHSDPAAVAALIAGVVGIAQAASLPSGPPDLGERFETQFPGVS